ncbi:aspartyl-phosphate phosphatase Spo0E family protein [Halalkalibacter kiskunsagensis]|uniref:Aspartyl-phosphate phosphatase Spo0E family protein n=1 Tax=Halalkalibacter kiskunsagensis TaxID=1548599 RepID=A0ABV6KA68_9BACI
MYVAVEKKRLQLMTLAKKYGMTAEITVQCSQELDKHLNLLQEIHHKPLHSLRTFGKVNTNYVISYFIL